MPANKKYLLQTKIGRTSKFLAAFLGGLFTTLSIHFALALWIDLIIVVNTALFSIFILWGLLMLLVYWVKKPIHSWGILLLMFSISVIAIIIKKNGG